MEEMTDFKIIQHLGHYVRRRFVNPRASKGQVE